MAEYIRKPYRVEAYQIGSNEPMPSWVEIAVVEEDGPKRVLCAPYWPVAKDGFWVVRSKEGNRYYSPEEFASAYEPAEPETPWYVQSDFDSYYER